jgi:hypothetical protein
MLPPTTIVTRADLEAILNRSTDTISRAVLDGVLPAPARMFGMDVWTVGSLTENIGRMLQLAEVEHTEAVKA